MATAIEDLIRENGIERIVFVPASELLSRDSFHVHLFDGWLAEHVGRGETVEAALEDVCRRVSERKAA